MGYWYPKFIHLPQNAHLQLKNAVKLAMKMATVVVIVMGKIMVFITELMVLRMYESQVIYNKMSIKQDLTGQQFGRLIVIKQLGNKIFSSGNKVSLWLCQCSCGNKHKVTSGNLKNKSTKSCGCLNSEQAVIRFTKHGFSLSKNNNSNIERKFYRIFKCIRVRCNNSTRKQFKDYGGRGIEIEWKSFDGFYKDMYKSFLQHIETHGEKNTSIDRKNNNKGYSKENCRWATRKEQMRNMRRNVNITFKGKTMCLIDWANEIGMQRQTLKSRLDAGLSIKEALTRPLLKYPI